MARCEELEENAVKDTSRPSGLMSRGDMTQFDRHKTGGHISPALPPGIVFRARAGKLARYETASRLPTVRSWHGRVPCGADPDSREPDLGRRGGLVRLDSACQKRRGHLQRAV